MHWVKIWCGARKREIMEEEIKENVGDVATPMTFDEILQDADYQREFDRKVSKALETAKGKWEKDFTARMEAEKSEAQKLAKMDADEKLKYQLDQALARVSELEAKDNASMLKDQALTIAKEKNIDVSLLELIDFTKENADSVNAKLNTIQSVFAKSLENSVNDKLKQPTPKQVATNDEKKDPLLEAFLKEYN